MRAVAAGLWKRVRGEVGDLAAAWHEFWCRPELPHTVCLMRLLVGGMLLYTHAVWGLRLTEFFAPEGWQSAEAVDLLRPRATDLSFWWLVPSGFVWPVHLLCLAVLAMFFVGYRTNVTSKLAFVIAMSYANRVPLANFGLDQINQFLTLYLAITPCGALYSVDALRRGDDGVVEPSTRARLGRRLIQVQLCVLYAWACLGKLKGDAWWDGNAIWMTAANLEYQSGSLVWLAWWPRLGELLTHATVLWEGSFWALVWNQRLRPYVLAIGTMMHLGIGAFLGMWTFGLIMTFAYVAFVSPRWLASLSERFTATDDGEDTVVASSENDGDDAMKQSGSWRSRVRRWLTGSPAESRRHAVANASRTVRGKLLYVDHSEEVRVHALGYFREQSFDVRAASSWHDVRSRQQMDDFDVIVIVASDWTSDELSAAEYDLATNESARVVVVLPERRHNEWLRSSDVVLASPVKMRELRHAIDRAGRDFVEVANA